MYSGRKIKTFTDWSLCVSVIIPLCLFFACVAVQATTTAQHTLRLDSFEGEIYQGALLYVTLSVNNFAYQSIEEVDPVDWWALLGSAGGMWGESDA